MDYSQKFSKTYRIHVYETGIDNKVTLPALFNYMQDIASDHAELLGFGRADLDKENHFWVLSRMYGEFFEMPEWEDEIIITTWPSGIEKVFLMRNYKIEFPDGRLIANVSSSWLIVDRTTRRVQRANHILNYDEISFFDTSKPVRSADKLEWNNEHLPEDHRFAIKLSDLDINYHTNNVNYIKWANDTYSPAFIKEYHPKSVEINYIAESMFGDDICIKSSHQENSADVFQHSIFRVNDNKEICRTRFEWIKKTEKE